MATIRISERSHLNDGRNAVVTFDGGGEYPTQVTSPFDLKQENDLEWYFEQHLRMPFLDTVRAAKASASVQAYGEAIFRQIFTANPSLLARYAVARQVEGVANLRFEVAGSAAFHQHHWEAMKDPELPRAFALEAPMVRRNLSPPALQSDVRSSPTINLLLVVARPGGRADVGYRTISRPLVEALRNTELLVRVDILRPGTYEALVKHLEDVRDRLGPGFYHVVHFDLHGALLSYEDFNKGCATDRYAYRTRYARNAVEPYEGRRAYLSFTSREHDRSDPAEAGEVAALLQGHQIPIAILNACQSGKQVGDKETSLGSRLMQAGVQLVVAMGYSVTVSAAQRMMTSLYGQLFEGQDLAIAIRRARLELYNDKERRAYFDQVIRLEDWVLPVVYLNRELNLHTRPMTSQESAEFYGRKVQAHPFPEPPYGFQGRDVDILEIENRLLKPGGNLMLVRGMGGAGKTTLVQHLAAWWQTTGLVGRVFSFAYDVKAWDRQQILRHIAETLLTKVDLAAHFDPLGIEAQQALIVGKLRASRHLLLLDNLESISGSPLSIPNTLQLSDQQALRGFLQALRGGKTLVLLGSRGDEAWLAPGTFDTNVYDLPGLDPEATSAMVERILERIDATKYRGDADLGRLLRLLDGYPLPLQVILSNLVTQTPTQILESLRGGLDGLDLKGVRDKTESVLKCIDYSFGNLAAGDQDLLSSLAWFSGICRQDILINYANQLRSQPALQSLPLDRFSNVVQQAMALGLATPHPMLAGCLQLQPTLPYFLRTRLNDPSRRALRDATEAAFVKTYANFCVAIFQLLRSPEPRRKLQARQVVQGDFENIAASLDLAPAASTEFIQLYWVLSLYFDEIADNDRGLGLCLKLVNRLQNLPAERLDRLSAFQMVTALHDAADRFVKLKRFANAKRSVRMALQSFRDYRLSEDEVMSGMKGPLLQLLGVVEQTRQRYERAERYYRRAWAIYKREKAENAQAEIVYQLAGLAKQRGQIDRSMRLWRRAIRLFRAESNELMMGDSYLSLGSTHLEKSEHDKARICYLRAGRIFKKHKRFNNYGRVLINLGAIESSLKRPSGEYSREALHLGIQLGDPFLQATAYNNLGNDASEEGDDEQAFAYYLKAIERCSEANEVEGLVKTLGNIYRIRDRLNSERVTSDVATAMGVTRDQVERMWTKFLPRPAIPDPGGAAEGGASPDLKSPPGDTAEGVEHQDVE